MPGATITHPWLAEMPAAPCRPPAIVRKGDILGVVDYNEGGLWRVTHIGSAGRKCTLGSTVANQPTPESGGWRHALDRPEGMYHVVGVVSAEADDESGDTEEWALQMVIAQMADDVDDTDRIIAARRLSAVLR